MSGFIWENFFRRSDEKQEVEDALRQTHVFSSLSKGELRFVQETVHVRSFKPGESVFRQGEVGVGMYVLLKGALDVFVDHFSNESAPQVNSHLVTRLKAGDFLGELSLVEHNSRRTATAVAAEESVLIGLFKPDLFEILERQPATGVKILLRLSEVLGRRLKETTLKVTELKEELRRNADKNMNWTVSQDTLKRVNFWKLAGLLALLLFSFLILITVENLLVSSLLAFVISYTLGPLVSTLERHGVSRGLSTVVVFVVVGILLILLGFWLFPYLGNTLSGLQGDMPHYIQGVVQFISEVEVRIRSIAGPLANFDVTGKVETQLTQWTHDFFDRLPGAVKTFVTVMLLGPFLAFFMIKDGRSVANLLLGLVPNHLFEPALSLLHQINLQIGQFVRARILESVIVGLVTTVGLLLISFPYAVLLGVFAGLTNFIPYLGPLLGAVPALLIVLVNGHTGFGVVLVTLVYATAQLIDAGLLIPMLVARIVDLHPVTVIVVIIAGAQVLGVLGMIISIPVASTLKVTVTTVYRHLTDTRS